MDEKMLDILHKSLLLNLGGSFEVYEQATLDEDPTIFQKFLEIISCHAYVPTNRFLVIRWYVNGYTVIDSYPEFAYDNIRTLDEMSKFVEKVVDKLKTRYKKQTKTKGDK